MLCGYFACKTYASINLTHSCETRKLQFNFRNKHQMTSCDSVNASIEIKVFYFYGVVQCCVWISPMYCFTNGVRLYEGHCLKQLLRPWCMPSAPARLTTATAPCTYQCTSLPVAAKWNHFSGAYHSAQRLNHITADIRDLLQWLSVQQRIKYKISMLIYKCLHQTAPIYLSELCISVAATTKWSYLRSAVQGNLVIRTKQYGQLSFVYYRPAL